MSSYMTLLCHPQKTPPSKTVFVSLSATTQEKLGTLIKWNISLTSVGYHTTVTSSYSQQCGLCCRVASLVNCWWKHVCSLCLLLRHPPPTPTWPHCWPHCSCSTDLTYFILSSSSNHHHIRGVQSTNQTLFGKSSLWPDLLCNKHH